MGVVAFGLSLGGCVGDPSPDDEEAEVSAEPLYGIATTTDDPNDTEATSLATSSSSESGSSSSGGTSGSSSGTSGTGAETETETDTDTGGTTLEPDYGVPTTSG